VLAYHHGLGGSIELGLEVLELFGFAVVVNQLPEASPVRYQGHPLSNHSQDSGKNTSGAPSQSEQSLLLSIVLDQGPEFCVFLCSITQLLAKNTQMPRDQLGELRAQLTIDKHALYYGDQ